MSTFALWALGEGNAELLPAQEGEGVLVKMLFSGISRGTERLVFEGRVPASQQESMRCNGQEGDFSFPVKFGYCAVGEVLEGELKGKKVFALYPHQNQFRIAQDQLHLLPQGLPEARAVLAANIETALNVVWDSQVSAGDRVNVIGAGVVGALVAYLISRIPGVEITLIDINPARSSLASDLGLAFERPENAPRNCDVVINTSASEDGLNLAIESARNEGRIVEASWFGAGKQSIALGGEFHNRRLSLISSQVGTIPNTKAPRWTFKRRMAKALELLADPTLDLLISGESDFSELGNDYATILSSPNTLCHRISYQR